MLVSTAALAAVVYKWTDSNGVVHYSDEPAPGAVKMQLGPAPMHGTPAAASNPTEGLAQKPKDPLKKPLPRLGYTEIVVVAPTAARTYVDEPVSVSLNLSPELQQGHVLTWYLNDSPRAETDTSFVIDRLDRGAYAMRATITDTASQETASSNTVTFYVRQPSLVGPLKPKK